MYSGMMNNNRTKALFFDIDGTLLSEKTRRVPDSAKEALKQAREKGAFSPDQYRPCVSSFNTDPFPGGCRWLPLRLWYLCESKR